MGKQMALLDVPQTHPTRSQRLEAFKERQGIWTWYCPEIPEPWEALLVPRARRRLAGYEKAAECDLPEELIWSFCALLDEWGLLAEGPSELAAVRNLCVKNRIPCDL